MSTPPSPSDPTTLRLQLDQVFADQKDFAQGLSSRQQQLEQLVREIEQYRGALSYIDIAQKRLTDEIKLIEATPASATS